MLITIYRTTGTTGSVIATELVHSFTADTWPDDLDEIMEEYDGDYYTVEDDL